MSPSGRSKRLEHRLNPIDRDVAAPHQLYLGFGQVNGPEGWGWCYIDEIMLDLSDRATPHNGQIPRFY